MRKIYNSDETNVKLDIKQTLLSNFPYPLFLLLFFSVYKLGLDHYNSLTDQSLKTIVIIFLMFGLIKLAYWIGKPVLVWNDLIISEKIIRR